MNKIEEDNKKTEPLNYHKIVEFVVRLQEGCKLNSSIGSKISGFLIDMVNIIESNVSYCVNCSQKKSNENILDKLMSKYRTKFKSYEGIE